eukprot:3142890-Rhodomonas_salina.2
MHAEVSDARYCSDAQRTARNNTHACSRAHFDPVYPWGKFFFLKQEPGGQYSSSSYPANP